MKTPLPILAALAIAGCASTKQAARDVAQAAAAGGTYTRDLAKPRPATTAERTDYDSTSSHADVLRFLDSLAAGGAQMTRLSLGRSTAGRDIPLVVASRPLVRTPREALALGRPIVWVQANIHAGEVEGKEAMQAMLRDLVRDPKPNVLDSIVLLVVPIYNADGNEQWASQSVNRTEQNGPGRVGQRANGQGLDLNRDYVKAEAPETRGSLAAFNTWDPDVLVDLHTTDGSFHGYALTYSPSLSPAGALGALTDGGAYARTMLLPELRRRVRERRHVETFDYGNFALDYGSDVNADTTKPGWYTYDNRPRFGTNYYALRGRISVLSEAYSHDPLRRRVEATDAFVRELLSLVAERGPEIVRRSRESDARVTAAATASPAPAVPVRASLTRSPYLGPVVQEDLARTTDTALTQPGVPRGLRRTGHFRTLTIPVFDHFDPERPRPLPQGWLLRAEDTAAVRVLRLHGVRVDSTAPGSPRVETFRADSTIVAPRPFQGHREVRLEGSWIAGAAGARAGWYVPAAQPLGVLAAYLLEPESDDGLVTWGILPADHPAVRVLR